MKETKREEAFGRAGFIPNSGGTHWDGCYRSHPNCAYLKGWDDAEAARHSLHRAIKQIASEKKEKSQ